MKKKVLLLLTAVVLMLSIVLTGCGATGIPQEQYDQLMSQFNTAQQKISESRDNIAKMEADMAANLAELNDAKKEIAGLQQQVNDLKALYEPAGLTPAEMAEKIVSDYHDTHVYSTIDMFVCSDMSSEIWNMLKAQGIGSVIVVGSIDHSVADILQSDHAWVLADVGPGERLALETTGGYVVTQARNPLYYHGWSFSSPADITLNNDLIKEYNLRVGFRNLLKDEVNAAMALYNNSSDQVEADKYYTLYNKLVELKTAQETILNSLMAQINGLAKQF